MTLSDENETSSGTEFNGDSPRSRTPTSTAEARARAMEGEAAEISKPQHEEEADGWGPTPIFRYGNYVGSHGWLGKRSDGRAAMGRLGGAATSTLHDGGGDD